MRDAAGIVADARLQDLRHAHASHAVMSGESLHVTGRLLGHRRSSTTNRYVHLDDATLGQAAERVAVAIERRLRPAFSRVTHATGEVSALTSRGTGGASDLFEQARRIT